MTVLVWLIPIAFGMGLVGLAAFLWSMRSGQYDDLDGAAARVLLHSEDDRPEAGSRAYSDVERQANRDGGIQAGASPRAGFQAGRQQGG